MRNFDARLSAGAEEYGVSEADAGAMHLLVQAFAADMARLSDPATRNKVVFASKRESRRAAVGMARRLVQIIAAHPGLSAGQREELRMNAKTVGKSPIAAPVSRPRLLLSWDGTVVLVDEAAPGRKAMPAGVHGAVISMRIGGDEPPASADQMHIGVMATRMRARLPVPPGNRGRMLWAVARWYTGRGVLGSPGEVVGVMIAA